jgi:peroxiredoxin
MTTSAAVPASPYEVCPLLTGTIIPAATLHTADGDVLDLNQTVREQPSVLVFYRGGWWPHCNKQLVQLREIEPELKALGVQILAISPDKPSKLRETIDKHKMSFTLLSDSDMVAARSFRVAYKLDAQSLAEFRKYNIDVEEASGQKHHMLPVPAVFLVARNGLLQFVYVNPDYKARLDPELLVVPAKITFKK